MNDFCRRCALIAAALVAGYGPPTHSEVMRARRALCLAALEDRQNEDEFIVAAFEKYGARDAKADSAMGRALFDYQNKQWNEGECVPTIEPGRVGELLHQHTEYDPS